jgi:Acyl-CoA dehydrogenase, middle domain/Acyl-CoA dehydrogenase, N-terminal domain
VPLSHALSMPLRSLSPMGGDTVEGRLPVVPSNAEDDLRREVREFLAAELPVGSCRPSLGLLGSSFSPEFTGKLARRGWLGLSIPPEYGGHPLPLIDRYIITEELLAAGAPIGAHAVGERQTAGLLLAFGTPAQREQFLPAIAAGEAFFCIGMSEPDAGSDLAGIRTTATRAESGWLLNGTKIWTSGAHERDWCVVLCRTSRDEEDRHAGMSQMIVNLRGPNISINPIAFLDGSAHFNEVVFEDTFVPDEMVLGVVGDGWHQVMSELSMERAGPDRFLSNWPTFVRCLAHICQGEPNERQAVLIGQLVSRLWVLREMALSLARTASELNVQAEGAALKDLGTQFEQEMVSALAEMIEDPVDMDSSDEWESLYAEAILVTPSSTIRGGTTEVLRSIVARSVLQNAPTR